MVARTFLTVPVASAALAGHFAHRPPHHALTSVQEAVAATSATASSGEVFSSELATNARDVAASSRVVPDTTTTTNAPSPAWADPVTASERAAWSRVNQCEEHGYWHVRGATYQGGLGISVSNWIAFGGMRDFGPEWAASPDQQIVVAMRIDPYPPDQHGCVGGW